MPKEKPVDIDGSEAVSKVLVELLNTYPGLQASQKIQFSALAETSGIGFFPVAGSAVQSHREDITGHVVQQCQYPFNIVYRAAPKTEDQRIRIKEILDTIGRWLECQPITISGKAYQLAAYPSLKSGDRKIQSISRANPAYLNAAYQDGIEDWVIAGNVLYSNEFDKL